MKLSHLNIIVCLSIASSYALALSTDSDQPIYIDSDNQQLDMKSNQVTFSGDVKLKQGSINITANEVVVTRNPKSGTIQEIEARGTKSKPSTFSQKTDDGKTLRGEARTLHYQMSDKQLTMTNQAMLAQDDSIIRGTKIRYNIQSQKLIADGNTKTNERVSTILQPQLTTKQ